ncbi:alpha-hydroxy acid oxidase [Comamonas endophytica]|uniref:Alpha-hydroxy-acid oxidizing protein n=1 Tax=Comamonas endophytica TaxID=2949090 RepID=A0ABY6GFQ9_9BURK|nr:MULTISPECIES: alpha-hydroxy acid oxidase [unclassified Acidovorax]MCD2514339.1 alpha-hydroxy-acid oxidizing protein [Acidovorax sp. D4N7]UYG53933.1 alpha-hydroxy-acid oxidizing protein [Acidovorax sp. 5MLIR]UYG53938.1 alpha-hydroxy-acid oxidizing protein [Acidovorax sp. 5MLIR]
MTKPAPPTPEASAGSAAAFRVTPALRGIHALHDFQPLARRKLPRQLYSYISNGADDEVSLRANRSAFDAYGFVPRMLEGVAERAQKTEIFGRMYESPFGISPVGLAAMWCYRGDLVLARAAQAMGIPAVMSGASLVPMEVVAQGAPDTWFQAYIPGDAARVEALIGRIAKAGFKTLVVTVDLPVQVNPERYLKNGFTTPLRPSLRLAWDGISHPRWLLGTFGKTLARHGMPHFENWRAERGAPILSARVERDFQARDHLDWLHLGMVRELWKGPLVVKGIMRWQDAVKAQNLGIDGIVVSNHGGRQVDGAISPLRVLPEIVAAAPKLTVMMDSGIRRGSDVLKALSLGARCVFNGRSFNYAATVAGHDGVCHAISILRAEIHRNMALLGINRLDELDPSFVRGPA